MQSVPVTTIMPTPTQITVVESSSSEAHGGDASGSAVLTGMLSDSLTQGSDKSFAEAEGSPTSAESTPSTGLADASGAQASTTTGLGGRVESSWYGVVGVGVVVATVLMV